MTDKIILPENVKSIDEFRDYYVGENGTVYSAKHGKIKTLSPEVTHNGYLRVTLSEGGEVKRFLLHRLVATAFIANPHKKKTVNHIDGNKSNNQAGNLEWATHSENHLHAYKVLGRKPNINQLGNFNEKSALSKRVFQYTEDGALLNEYPSVNEAGRQNPRVDAKNISAACLGKIKSCGGYVWKYSKTSNLKRK